METKPIGSINTAYVGCLLLAMALGAGITIGLLTMFILLRLS
jgi:hypothetical protein